MASIEYWNELFRTEAKDYDELIKELMVPHFPGDSWKLLKGLNPKQRRFVQTLFSAATHPVFGTAMTLHVGAAAGIPLSKGGVRMVVEQVKRNEIPAHYDLAIRKYREWLKQTLQEDRDTYGTASE